MKFDVASSIDFQVLRSLVHDRYRIYLVKQHLSLKFGIASACSKFRPIYHQVCPKLHTHL